MLQGRCFTGLLLSRSRILEHRVRVFTVARQLVPVVASRLTLMVLFAYDTEISIIAKETSVAYVAFSKGT